MKQYKKELVEIASKECTEKNLGGIIRWLFDKNVVNKVGAKRYVIYNEFIEELKTTKENKDITIYSIIKNLSKKHDISHRYVQYICSEYSQL